MIKKTLKLTILLSLIISCNKDPEPISNSENDMFAAADPVKGKTLFVTCAACHNVNEGEPSKGAPDGRFSYHGPSLWGVYGRNIATLDDFEYSFQMKKYQDKVWNHETLDKWIRKPKKFIPGNRMLYNGNGDPQDRMDIIAYLKTLQPKTKNNNKKKVK